MIRSLSRSVFLPFSVFFFFFFNDTATTEIYTLSLHDALPITRLNSSHDQISYAVFCVKKKTNTAAYRVHDETEGTMGALPDHLMIIYSRAQCQRRHYSICTRHHRVASNCSRC